MRLSRLYSTLIGASSGALVLAAAALAGGTSENVILIINPNDATSLHVGNYYRRVRNIPESNVLYIDSAATGYAAFNTSVLDAVVASLSQRGLTDHADYMVLAPSSTFFIPAAGLVADGCFPIGRFAVSSAYTFHFVRADILSGSLNQSAPNRYFAPNDSAVGFDSSVAWLSGQVSIQPTARRYFIGATLGYTGERGNTTAEILAMIDRSVAVDGTRPAGTFYFMNNVGDPVRNVRACGLQGPPFCDASQAPTLYNTADNSITIRGGVAEVITGAVAVPQSRTDCLGIMTGTTDFDVAAAGSALLPGAFCDHLTSFGAMFDNDSQTKISRWIASGASGAAGTVDEPCNYTGKFNHVRFHVYYQQGLSLGESYLRSIAFLPFQNLLYGDPITRPFAHIPSVGSSGFQAGPTFGTHVFTPSASTTHPTATINTFELYIDGVLRGSVGIGQSFSVDTTTLDDGFHDARILAYDNSAVRSVGAIRGPLWTANYGRSVNVLGAPFTGNLSTLFTFTATPIGGAVREIRLIQNGRVLAASTTSPASLSVYGQNLGAGISDVRTQVVYMDNRVALGMPLMTTVAPGGTPGANPPIAFNYSKDLFTPTNYIVELPAAFDADPSTATYTLLSSPSQATLINPGLTGPYRIVRPNAGAAGSEPITFRVTTPAGTSNVATVTLIYTAPPPPCAPDWNTDGILNSQDFFDFLADFFAGNADFNNDSLTNSQDFFDFLAEFFTGC